MKLTQLLTTERGKDLGLFLLRIGFGAGMVYHGYGKVASGAEGVIGFAASAGFPLPFLFGWAGALSEFLGGLFLVTGLLTRPSAFFIASTMFTAAFVRHWNDPFSDKELALTYMTASICILIAGAGKYSIDQYIFKSSNTSSEE